MTGQTSKGVTHRGQTPALSIAPMMDRSDRHFRLLMRLITRHTLLYTEMVTCPAVLFGDRDRVLGYDALEHPLAIQLGGDDPDQLARCAEIAAELGYDEVNLNVGCPSDRVQNGNFGACLMRDPDRVAACVTAMRRAVDLPVTVKHRIGVDELDAYEDMLGFVERVAAAGADRFTVHARKAWLAGLSPKQNRTIPPLRYADVHRLKAEHPELDIEINGGIRELGEIAAQLEQVDAVMIGRAAWSDPWLFAAVDARFFPEREGGHAWRSRRPVVSRYLEHVLAQLDDPRPRGPSPTILLRPLLNLFTGCPGAKRWKRAVSTKCQAPAQLEELLALIDELEALARPMGTPADCAAAP
ncbi:tRNA dihydrouridine(20/20a) synthase DusA [Pseudenhygromyxa sp. WMMC2535]|uniref:tRNA dihydrouridine(20/20a) synthase DusA n=1 Tax=Pseudenhygromyxa sp. WMMC2535 TaxID=2712867 RepID=UPI0015529FE6|nr:tRNA dihydrouridine(20/20a) synthase DusA [Pseudenhygromyxa sp. WMMC2535]NVB43196.1 tRNA dihydrouridine(20/20a) synthase DusA [Pseudenhygromyxa sp. WMMC2535]